MGIYEYQGANCVCDVCDRLLLRPDDAEGVDREEVSEILREEGWRRVDMDIWCPSCVKREERELS